MSTLNRMGKCVEKAAFAWGLSSQQGDFALSLGVFTVQLMPFKKTEERNWCTVERAWV